MPNEVCSCVIHHAGPSAVWAKDEVSTIGHIETEGWSVLQVASDTEEDWAYTVGMNHSFGGPELVMAGLVLEHMPYWINRVGERIKSGKQLSDGDSVDGVLEGHQLLLRSVHPDWFHTLFGWGVWFYQHRPFPMLQVVWPDKDGAWPWEEHASVRCRNAQPRLWLSPSEHPEGLWTELYEEVSRPKRLRSTRLRNLWPSAKRRRKLRE